MKRSGFKIMSSLIVLIRPLSLHMILAILMGVVGQLMASFITILGGYAILRVLKIETSLSLSVIFIAVLCFAVLRGFLRYAEQSCNHFIAFKILALIRDKVFAALRRLCPAKLEGRDRGNLISIITSDIELLEVFYAHTISPICIATIFSAIMVCFISSYNSILGIMALFMYLIVGVIIPIITSKLAGSTALNFRNKSGELSSFVLDSLRGLLEIMQYNYGREQLSRMSKRTSDISKDEAQMSKNLARNTAITNTTILVFDFIMLIFSAYLCGFRGSLITTLALMSSFGPVVALATLGATLQNTFAAGNRVLNILEEEPICEDISGKEEIEFCGATTEHIMFSYGGENIIKDLSIEIPKNKIIGINGRSGSGKSTLLKLLMRFWEVDDGEVRVSGRSIADINTGNLRDMESFVTQETFLFHDTIRNNLCIAKQDATEEEIVEACKKVAVHDFIKGLKKGYDTEVGELGDTLSGGECQRLGLARAFLCNAPFMLLDEPTSNLDSLNEAVILKALKEGRNGKTVVLVSHRRSTMGITDKVYSVENGRLS